jgi:protein phosphatase
MILRAGSVCSLGYGPAAGGISRNEDNFLIASDGQARWRDENSEVTHPWPGEGTLIGVADGMGGHADGHLASLKAVQALAGWPGAPHITDPEGALRQFILEAHHEIRATMLRPIQMGTTLIACWILGERLVWCHVGDSRLFVLRRGVLHLLTRDHTRSEFAERDGRQPPSHPQLLAQNFIFGSRGLGTDNSLRIDRGLDTGMLMLESGDRLLLCSDGLYAWAEESELGAILQAAIDPAQAATQMVALAMANHSDDNATAVVLFADRRTMNLSATIIPLPH